VGSTGFNIEYINNGERCFIKYIYKDSPAGRAGLRRGMEILEINGETIKKITENNLNSTILGKEEKGVKVNLKIKDNSEIRDITLVKDIVKMNTVLASKIIELNNEKIGYLVFNNFIEPSIDELDEVFSKFKAENIDDLVLDLRYNGGGRATVGLYLASLIGGDITVNNILNTAKYNDNYSHWNHSFILKKEKNSLNLNRNLYINYNYTSILEKLRVW